MIPKIIHYCWLSDEPIPQKLQSYIDGWRKIMPDYKFKCWNKQVFDIHSVKWVEQAYENKKWAFAADYIRAYALYTEGGFYLDSDVLLNKRLDKFLGCGFVSSIEYNPSCRDIIRHGIDKNANRKDERHYLSGLGIQAAIIGGEPKNPFLKDLMDYYNERKFIKDDGSFDMLPAPVIYMLLLEKYGIKYIDKTQTLKDSIKIFNSGVFSSIATCKFTSTAIHMEAGSWVEQKHKSSNWIKNLLRNSLFIRKLTNQFGLRSL